MCILQRTQPLYLPRKCFGSVGMWKYPVTPSSTVLRITQFSTSRTIVIRHAQSIHIRVLTVNRRLQQHNVRLSFPMAHIGVSVYDIIHGVVCQTRLLIFPTEYEGGREVLCRAVCSSILLFGAVISLVFGTVISSYGCDICDSIQAIQIL